jgi:transposase
MLSLIERSPDIFLDEIQDQLFEQHELEVSLSTIWRTLKRLGITSKKVHPYFDSHITPVPKQSLAIKSRIGAMC